MEFLKSHWFHILLDCENSLSGTVCLQERKGEELTELMIKLPIFKKNKCSYLYKPYVSLSAGNTVSKLKWGWKMENFCGVPTSSRPPNCIWNKPNLFANSSPCSDSSICNDIFPIIDQWRFFFLISWISSDILNVLDKYIIFVIWAAWVLTFVLSKNKGFHSGTSLKNLPRRNKV